MPEQSAGILGLTDRVRAEIHRHVFGSPDREVGGVLVGQRIDTRAVQVRGMIPALEAVGEAAAVTFTHDAWELVHRELDQRFAGLQIVGWYHSHPGFGIFLSRDDLFIHESFFSETWQFAYVIDPISLEEGEFGWSEGRVVPIQTRPIAPPPGYRPPAARARQEISALEGAPLDLPPAPEAWPGGTAVAPPPLGPPARRYPLAAILAPLAIGLALGFWLGPAIGIGDSGDGGRATAPVEEASVERQPKPDATPEAKGSARAANASPTISSPPPAPSAVTPTTGSTPPTKTQAPITKPEQEPAPSSGGVGVGGTTAPEGKATKAYCEEQLANETLPEECDYIIGE